jgi:hypothetical protein
MEEERATGSIEDPCQWGRFDTFETYCRERWSITRVHADRLISAVDVANRLKPIGFDLPNESQARELGGLDTETAAQVMAQAHAATNGKPTAAVIREIRPTHWAIALS